MLKTNKDIPKKLLVFLAVIFYFAVAYTVMNYFGISCVFLEFFKIPCPGCGMTRAFLCLLKGDFSGAAAYNVTIFFLPYVVVYLLFELRHRIHRYLLLGIAAVAMINWMIKIILF
ncbi:MAG: DUF2752 domain-containing protein [Clostridia bacterium]|nr:DUF2752 domain-containing protein [Clostridia bacterium]